MKTQNFYTVRQVQEIVFAGALGLTTLHHMINKGEIPAERFANKKLIPAGWVKAQLEKAGATAL